MDQHSNGSNQDNQQQGFTNHESQQSTYNQSAPFNQPSQSGFSDMPPLDKSNWPQSKLGITSFIISMLAVIGIIITFILGASIVSDIVADKELMDEIMLYAENPQAYTNDELMNSKFGEAMLSIMGAVVISIGSVAISFVGLILGIIALSSKNKKKTFGLLGVIFNALVLIGTVGLFLMGLIMGVAGV